MPHDRALLAAVLALALLPASAGAQAPQAAPAAPASPTEPAPAAPSAPPADDPLAADREDGSLVETPVDERMVEVSLGDWGVKNEVASALEVGISDVPLTVVVDTNLAAEVCPIGQDDLSEQSVVAATRTCAAKTFVPALADRAREQMRPPAR
ncbi:hypothetical protein [Antarcticirhabdus aurantiaca]|uniref:Uncharacterized protein n=1 Tax=Antarcticirhabdus aurantiaca TaxID=2606717 RepID=A0ACD4NHV9_9HYPH|nr:hypothetical protein [Antarcticirhabdus aurantiaca]WAJ26403.1 hypothetical protein OXU80_16040 [Jeongeuplla avenae]